MEDAAELPDDAAYLLARWDEAFPRRRALGAELVHRYDDPMRIYHDLRHLRTVLDVVDTLFGEMAGAVGRSADALDRRAVTLAAWFHDAVYEIPAADNEEASARLAESVLPAYDFDEETTTEVARLVRLTRDHAVAAGDVNGAVLSDADLSILASPADRYDDYALEIRAEYHHLRETVFRRGRADVLGRLLARPALFHTPYGRANWEAPARANIERELALIRG